MRPGNVFPHWCARMQVESGRSPCLEFCSWWGQDLPLPGGADTFGYPGAGSLSDTESAPSPLDVTLAVIWKVCGTSSVALSAWLGFEDIFASGRAPLGCVLGLVFSLVICIQRWKNSHPQIFLMPALICISTCCDYSFFTSFLKSQVEIKRLCLISLLLKLWCLMYSQTQINYCLCQMHKTTSPKAVQNKPHTTN